MDLKISWRKALPFALVHLACLGVFWVGVSWAALGVALAGFLVRMFAITAGYHRYFSHRSYKTGRVFQFVLAWLGASAAQLGPLWWAAHHRDHHTHADTERDAHPPGLRGFLWAHTGWFLCPRYSLANYDRVRDLARYPELLFLERHWLLPPMVYALALWNWGPQMLVWGFFVSTVLLYHATFCINSLAHVYGDRAYDTKDDSRNNFWLALVTLGEGWHNNHHRYPASERQGFLWWQIDITHYVLSLLSLTGLVWDLRQPPAAAFQSR